MTSRRKRFSLAAAMLALGALLAPQAMAAPTPPCTEISNQATIAYEVGGVLQPTVESDDDGNIADPDNPDATTFNVGVKIIVTVARADGSYVGVIPSDTDVNWLSFTVTNSGNATHQYDLDYFAAAAGTYSPFGSDPEDEDTFDGTTINIFVESSAASDDPVDYNAYDYDAGTDTGTTLTLAPGMTNKVYIVYTPDDLQEPMDSVAVYYLRALTQWADGSSLPGTLTDDGNDSLSVTDAMVGGATCGTNDDPTVDVVLGDEDGDDGEPSDNDGERDGAHIDKDAFIVQNAIITHTKTFEIISDGINTSAPYKAIPGAVVRYTLEIENVGNAPATLGDITDVLDGNFVIVADANDATWAVTGTPAPTRTTTSGDLTADTNAADGLANTVAPPATGGTLTAAMATILAADNGNGYEAGELKAGEKVTIEFSATIQ